MSSFLGWTEIFRLSRPRHPHTLAIALKSLPPAAVVDGPSICRADLAHMSDNMEIAAIAHVTGDEPPAGYAFGGTVSMTSLACSSAALLLPSRAVGYFSSRVLSRRSK